MPALRTNTIQAGILGSEKSLGQVSWVTGAKLNKGEYSASTWIFPTACCMGAKCSMAGVSVSRIKPDLFDPADPTKSIHSECLALEREVNAWKLGSTNAKLDWVGEENGDRSAVAGEED
jgi:hypothetical protein